MANIISLCLIYLPFYSAESILQCGCRARKFDWSLWKARAPRSFDGRWLPNQAVGLMAPAKAVINIIIISYLPSNNYRLCGIPLQNRRFTSIHSAMMMSWFHNSSSTLFWWGYDVMSHCDSSRFRRVQGAFNSRYLLLSKRLHVSNKTM